MSTRAPDVLWKLAVVLKQPQRRHHAGKTTDSRSAVFGPRANDILRSAAEMASEYARNA